MLKHFTEKNLRRRFTGRQLDISSKAYVDQSVPSIIRTWSKDELLVRASKELSETLTDQQWDSFFSQISRLGKLQKYEGSQGQSLIELTPDHGKVVTATYTASATFEHGRANIMIRLIQRNGRWLIMNFHVNVPVFT